ncbi:hypothetical protein [Teredinibacter franksiae]|uniref:hypothetical protein n=1 Tax=Teredinibacter franksiae TaxID=2761453 RepID=UPI001628D443|nr:hypothetical protein [Teredinibacter franksiae]
MSSWLYPANIKHYDVFTAFKQASVAWPINSKIELGDIVYFYISAPHQNIQFVGTVKKLNISEAEIQKRTLPFVRTQNAEAPKKRFMLLGNIRALKPVFANSLNFVNLKCNGLNGALMGPRKLDNNELLFNYVREHDNGV